MQNIVTAVAKELSLREDYVQNIITLLDDGNTVPFIARYRKEMHGSMDDQMIRTLVDRVQYLRNLEQRKTEVLSSIEEQGKLTDELKEQIEAAVTLAEVEDLYRPYKQKRRTRATIAKEKGLEPLAELILAGGEGKTLAEIAADFIDEEKEVNTVEDALAGANDIIAEQLSDNAEIRRLLKELINKRGFISSKAATEEDSVYRQYYEFSEPVHKIQSHRILAINRGEKEKFLKVSVEIDEGEALRILLNRLPEGEAEYNAFYLAVAEDSYSRLIFPSVEREIRSNLTEMASEQAIKMFGANLKPLLMQPPVKDRVTLGFDPAYRTGCKIAVVDGTGKVLDTTVVYPTPPHNKKEEAAAKLSALIKKHGITAIAVGNGTASKESEIFISELIKEHEGVQYMMVNEAGASVYSASKLGAEEFPDFDVSLRSAVSIARRLQDPLAELVKIDPKSIGVGQYQHDMPEARLNETLTGVVEDCVNAVGVDLNTASPSLLTRVSGLNASIAKNIVAHREENGEFKDRKTLLKVSKLGPKAFTQCAGFLRVVGGKNILDNTGVHPESYEAAEIMLKNLGFTPKDVADGNLGDLESKLEAFGVDKMAELCSVGVPTVKDIAKELQKPGRDPRDELVKPMLRSDIMDMNDLKEGMILDGTVRNVIDFGVFVDIGVHQDGLVHISEICNRFIKHPSEVLTVGDLVKVMVIGVDVAKKRISLSIKQVKN
ncbi:MAG: RNA-binding transcriptional accessory protein [Ruminococcaceae bacterium]|nr:RNA-binding transcriptional accessory protein [Oscillospiraceae bacterium]